MHKGIEINYPKPKPKLKPEDLADFKEPNRRSMYQVLIDNLKLAKRGTYLHRLIYVGDHTFTTFDEAKCCFEATIKKANEMYSIEKLSGFFLYYTRHFVHMVEGDEDNINRHLSFLLNEENTYFSNLGMLKLLIFVSHINQRFFEDWQCLTGIPAKLMETMDNSDPDLSYSARHVYNCIKKLYYLASNYSDDLKLEASAETESSAGASSFEINRNSLVQMARQSSPDIDTLGRISAFSALNSYSISIQKDYIKYLPEYELLDFAIQSNFTMKLIDFYKLYGSVPMRDIYKDRVWPVPHDLIPFYILEEPYDCVTDLAKGAGRQSVIPKYSMMFYRRSSKMN